MRDIDDLLAMLDLGDAKPSNTKKASGAKVDGQGGNKGGKGKKKAGKKKK